MSITETRVCVETEKREDIERFLKKDVTINAKETSCNDVVAAGF